MLHRHEALQKIAKPCVIRIWWEACPACHATHPEWAAFKQHAAKDPHIRHNMNIFDVERAMLPRLAEMEDMFKRIHDKVTAYPTVVLTSPEHHDVKEVDGFRSHDLMDAARRHAMSAPKPLLRLKAPRAIVARPRAPAKPKVRARPKPRPQAKPNRAIRRRA